VSEPKHYERAQTLIDRHRPKDAEQELVKHIASQPQDPWGHSLMATALAMQKKHEPATASAKEAISLNPHEAWFHYILADVYYGKRLYADSQRCIDEALRLAPDRPRYWGLKANIESANGNWKGALKAAETGLEYDPNYVHCKNLRALALARLGDKKQAEATFSESLSQDPENALTFAYRGWTHVHNNEPDAAISAFSEALRLDPAMDWARMGMMAALRDTHWLFAIARKLARPWILFCIGVCLIASAFLTAATSIAAQHNQFLLPICLLSMCAVIACGLAFLLGCMPFDDMSDTTLTFIMTFDSRGKYLLTEEERHQAKITAIVMPFAIAVGLIAGHLRYHPEVLHQFFGLK
jgi:tetratricopeptide (TPR) repeat protein